MVRKTKRTLRRLPATSKELAKAANEADRISRLLHKAALKVADLEADSKALQNYYASLDKSNG